MIPIKIPIHIPTLYIDNLFGKIGYIDFIKPKQLTSSIMKGIDSINRRFIVIKMNIDNKHLFQTFFNVHSDCEGLWIGAGLIGIHLICARVVMTDFQFKLIEDIINDKVIKIEEKHNPNIDSFIGKYVSNEKIYNACLKIQKAWRLCRYNPNYKMCEIVQMNNYKDIVNSYI